MNFEAAQRNESVEKMPGDKLYLLVSGDGTMFKIGITQNIGGRISQLKGAWGEIDTNSSYLVGGDGMRMRSLEQMLHFLYEGQNIEHETSKDGHTEWFDISCFDEVVEEIERVAEVKNEAKLVVQKGITLPKAEGRSEIDFVNAEERLAQRQEEITSGNFERAEEFDSLSQEIRPYIDRTEIIDNGECIVLHISGRTSEVEPLINPIMRAGYIEAFNGASNSIPHCSGEREIEGNTEFHLTINRKTLEEYREHPEAEVLAAKILGFLDSIQ